MSHIKKTIPDSSQQVLEMIKLRRTESWTLDFCTQATVRNIENQEDGAFNSGLG